MLSVEQIRSVVFDFFQDKPIKTVYLFGSYARGEATEESDVDLLLEWTEGKKKLGLFDIVRYKLDLEDLLNKNVELVDEKFVYSGIRPFIEKDKKLLVQYGGRQ